MSDWQTCDNCSGNPRCYTEHDVYYYPVNVTAPSRIIRCTDWKPIPCPRCGGALSETREHNGKKYRHCYACHFEFEI